MKIANSVSNVLSDLGLNEYELRIYAACIEIGRASANLLAKRTGIPRTSVYSAIDRLKDKGLLVLEPRKKVQTYLPANPQTLVTLAKEKVKKANDALEQAKKVSAMLESAQGRDAMTISKVLIFEGNLAVKKMLDDWSKTWRNSIVKYRRPWSGFQDDSYFKHYGDSVIEYWRRFQGDKDEEHNQLRLFSEDGPEARAVEKRVAKISGQRRQLRPLPGVNCFSATLWIVGEYLVLLKTQHSPHYALQVRDPLLAENVYAVFETLWKITE